jgi:hypothetical protein
VLGSGFSIGDPSISHASIQDSGDRIPNDISSAPFSARLTDHVRSAVQQRRSTR